MTSRTVGVIGSGSEEHAELAGAVGVLIASLGVNLLTGGGRGVMLAAARAYCASERHGGISIGIIPCASVEERGRAKAGYPNEFVELAIQTHLPYSGLRGKDDLSRNHINVLSCAAIVALPGGAGTEAEIELALGYGRPVIGYGREDMGTGNMEQAATIRDVEVFLRGELGMG